MRTILLLCVTLLLLDNVNCKPRLWFLPDIWPFNTTSGEDEVTSAPINDTDGGNTTVVELEWLLVLEEEGEVGNTTTTVELDTTTTIMPSSTRETSEEVVPDRLRMVRKKPTHSTAEPGDVDGKTVATTQPSTTTTTTTAAAATISVERLQPQVTDTPEECVNYTSDQLYKLLASVGGVNQQFMADTPEQAGRNFVDLSRSDGMLDDDDMHDGSHKDVFITLQNVSLLQPSCDARCEQIQQRLNDSMSRIDLFNRTSINSRLRDDVGEGEIDESVFGCAIDFVPLSNSCSPRGEEELWGHEKLCSSCHGVYVLSRWCFPRFFNAITCNKKDAKCIYDLWTTRAHGTCKSRTLHFSVLRNAGSVDCQRWVVESVAMPIACECYLSKNSIWLKA